LSSKSHNLTSCFLIDTLNKEYNDAYCDILDYYTDRQQGGTILTVIVICASIVLARMLRVIFQ